MRGRIVVVVLFLLILCQPLAGHGRLRHLSPLLFPLIGLAVCVGSLRIVLRCLLCPSPEETGRFGGA
jgi:hypothetical protein